MIALLPFLSGAWNVLRAAFAFCAKPPGSWITAAALIAFAIWFAHARGLAEGKAQAEAAQKNAQARATAIESAANTELASALAKLNVKIAANYGEEQSRAIYLTRTIVERIPVDVSPQTDRRYPLPCGLVRLHDAAFLGADPARLAAAGCEADDEPAPATASAFSRNDAEWADYCHEVEAQRDALKAQLLGVYGARDDYRASLAKAH
jgi:hypothetical protein